MNTVTPYAKRAINSKRGQAFLREMAGALDIMAEKRLIMGSCFRGDQVDALGAVVVARGLDTPKTKIGLGLPPGAGGADASFQSAYVAQLLGIQESLVEELLRIGDEVCEECSPQERWEKVRYWVESQLV